MADIEAYMSEKLFYGYWYENKVDGTMYIGKGSEDDKRNRIDTHLIDYLMPSRKDACKHFYAALRKYGPENFDRCIFQYFDTEKEAYQAENEWILMLRSFGVRLYNIYDGGVGMMSGERHPLYGKPMLKSTKQKIGDANRGKSKIPNEIQLQICQAYKKCPIVARLATTFRFTEETIQRVLKRNNIDLVDPNRVRRGVSEKEELEICYLYSNKYRLHEIADMYGVRFPLISKILSEHNIKIKGGKQRFFEHEEKEIYNKYCELLVYLQVAKLYRCSSMCVEGIVARHKDQRLENAIAKKCKQDSFIEKQICESYMANTKETLSSLARKFSLSGGSIKSILIKNNIPIRDYNGKGELGGNSKLIDEDIPIIKADKRPTKEIANDYGVVSSTISNIKSGKKWTHIK